MEMPHPRRRLGRRAIRSARGPADGAGGGGRARQPHHRGPGVGASARARCSRRARSSGPAQLKAGLRRGALQRPRGAHPRDRILAGQVLPRTGPTTLAQQAAASLASVCAACSAECHSLKACTAPAALRLRSRGAHARAERARSRVVLYESWPLTLLSVT